MTAECPVCGAPQSLGLLCAADTEFLEKRLAEVPALIDELDTTLSKQARIGGPGGGSSPARERWAYSPGASLATDVLTNTLTTWARDISNDQPWGDSDLHPAVQAAYFLLSNIDPIRRHPAVKDLYEEVVEGGKQAWHAVDRAAERSFVGPCLQPFTMEEGGTVTCTEDLYARLGAVEVRCRVCGAEHVVAERRAWLLEQARDRLFTVREAAQMMGDVGGIRVTEAAIRGYIFRPANPLDYRPGTKLIRLGDLLAVVLDESERKAS